MHSGIELGASLAESTCKFVHLLNIARVRFGFLPIIRFAGIARLQFRLFDRDLFAVDGDFPLGVLVVLLITALTGWFVAQEFAFLAVDRTRLAETAR